MKISDVIFNIHGHEFPAHKLILATRSEVFAVMFQHPTTENLTYQVKIEDIEPEVFQELLIYKKPTLWTGNITIHKIKAALILKWRQLTSGLPVMLHRMKLDRAQLQCVPYLESECWTTIPCWYSGLWLHWRRRHQFNRQSIYTQMWYIHRLLA